MGIIWYFLNYYRWRKLKRDGKRDELQFDEEDALEWEERKHKEVNKIDIQKAGLVQL